MSDLRRCMQASNSDSDTDESSSDSGQSPRKRRKEKREHTHKRSPRNDKSRIRKRHKEKKHKRHKERHHRDKISSPRHKERHHIDKVASPRSIDKEAKSPRSVMADPKSGMFCPQKSRVLQESEAVAERRLAAAKHCAEQRETASTYQAVVTVAPPVQWSRERARAALASRPYLPVSRERGLPWQADPICPFLRLTTDSWARAGDARGVAALPRCRVALGRRRHRQPKRQHHLHLRAVAHHGPTIALGS